VVGFTSYPIYPQLKISRKIVENHSTETNRKSDKKKKMELDWTYSKQRRRSNRENRIRLDPQGYRRRGRLKRTWQRTLEDERRSTGRSWKEVKGIAGDRKAWKLFMDALCTTPHISILPAGCQHIPPFRANPLLLASATTTEMATATKRSPVTTATELTVTLVAMLLENPV
jgi:hypothetical protein